jgi:hypothetical protein
MDEGSWRIGTEYNNKLYKYKAVKMLQNVYFKITFKQK